jgi:exodeoxyribonuclease VII large subunit
MTSRTVNEVADHIADSIRKCEFGLVAVEGELHGWRRFRSGIGVAELVHHDAKAGARLKVLASHHAAKSVADQLDALDGAERNAPRVVVHGHVVFDPRWGLQIKLLRLTVGRQEPARGVDDERACPNGAIAWPSSITTVGLVAPSGGDDAVADVEVVLAEAGVETIEHRVAVTGRRASVLIVQALDRLALDPRVDVTLLVRGGGPVSDFAVYDEALIGIAIDRHRHPVITGLGHATNSTLADRAAHTACITPTAAAHQVTRWCS